MGRPGAYLNIERKGHGVRPTKEAVLDFDDIVIELDDADRKSQASRCMNCGVAFCQSGIKFKGSRHATGCPLHNLIPETNDLIYQARFSDAAGRLAMTNPFPEFTGRVCPAPCETACNLGLNDCAVTIQDNERAISDHAWAEGIAPLPTPDADAPLISVIGSGPAGLACAWDLARRGFRVRVYERDDRPGGLLMYGIPNMKLPKWVIDRRIDLMKESGIEFICGMDAADIASQIAGESDQVILACGARNPRSISVPGTDLDGVHFALDYLQEATSALLEDREPEITAKGKDVAVIGGGDTGVDCVATAIRQGANSVKQIIRASRPSSDVDLHDQWPGPKAIDVQGYGQKEAEDLFGQDPRLFGTDTTELIGKGRVSAVSVEPLDAQGAKGEIPAQLVLIAKGFLGPEDSVIDAFSEFDNVHIAGDARLGATLVATAIADGLETASNVASLFPES